MNVKAVVKAVKQASIQAKRKFALEVEREAKTSMEGGKQRVVTVRAAKTAASTGRKAKKTTISVPSAPGSPPNVQTGIGRGSITSAPLMGGLFYIVGPSSPPAPYMAAHEFGGRFHPPRPFMRPALIKMAPSYAGMFRRLPLSVTQAGRRLEREAKSWRSRNVKK